MPRKPVPTPHHNVTPDHPRAMRPSKVRLNALAIVPAGDGDPLPRIGHRGDMRVHGAPEAVRNAGQDARPARGVRREEDLRASGLRDRLGGRSIGRITGLGEIRARRDKNLRGSATGELGERLVDAGTDDTDAKRGDTREGAARRHHLKRTTGEDSVSGHMEKDKDGIHGRKVRRQKLEGKSRRAEVRDQRAEAGGTPQARGSFSLVAEFILHRSAFILSL